MKNKPVSKHLLRLHHQPHIWLVGNVGERIPFRHPSNFRHQPRGQRRQRSGDVKNTAAGSVKVDETAVQGDVTSSGAGSVSILNFTVDGTVSKERGSRFRDGDRRHGRRCWRVRHAGERCGEWKSCLRQRKNICYAHRGARRSSGRGAPFPRRGNVYRDGRYGGHCLRYDASVHRCAECDVPLQVDERLPSGVYGQ